MPATLLAVDLVAKYEDGFLPHIGGWMDQDWFYIFLISEALTTKRERERIEEHKKALKSRVGKKWR